MVFGSNRIHSSETMRYNGNRDTITTNGPFRDLTKKMFELIFLPGMFDWVEITENGIRAECR